MKLLLINAVCGIRSTGRICVDIAEQYEKDGYDVKIAYGRENVPKQYEKYAVKIGGNADVYAHALGHKLFDNRGAYSKSATKKFLEWADEFDPDILWLHNLHDFYINIKLLFGWIKSRPNMQVKWTQHDCWAFTGGCYHYQISKCNKWQSKCDSCPKVSSSRGIFLKTKKNFELKKKLFCGIKNMTLITPSYWLREEVQKSFLKEYPIEVVHNKIDLNVFKPTEGDFRKRYGLEGKTIILGVASAWSKEKGLDDFIKLSTMLDDGKKIVLVGLKKEQMKNVPESILVIPRTNNAKELAEIYTTSDVFLNLTYEDTYPTVNLEAQACGTPVITYKTGGSPESVPTENVVECGNLEEIVEKLKSIKILKVNTDF